MPVTNVANSSAIQYTVKDLVTMVQDMTFVSDSARDWPPDKIIRLLNRCLFNYLVPFVVAADEEFYVQYQDVALVSNQQNYPLPTGCHNQNLRIVQLLDTQLVPSRVLVQRELDVALNPFTLFGVTAGLGTPSSFYIEGNQLYLVPIPSSGSGVGGIRLHYPLRPNQLVPPFDTAGNYDEAIEQVITGVTSSTITLGNTTNTPVMSGASPYIGVASTVDIVAADPPFDVLITPTSQVAAQTSGAVPNVGTLNYTYVSPTNGPPIPPSLFVGRTVWVSLSTTAPVVTMTPIEVSFGLMTQWACAKIMESKGDDAGYERCMRSLVVEEERAKEMLRRRVRGPGKRAFANPYGGKGGRGIVAFYT